MANVETYFQIATFILAIVAVKCIIVVGFLECTLPAKRAYLRNTGKRAKRATYRYH